MFMRGKNRERAKEPLKLDRTQMMRVGEPDHNTRSTQKHLNQVRREPNPKCRRCSKEDKIPLHLKLVSNSVKHLQPIDFQQQDVSNGLAKIRL